MQWKSSEMCFGMNIRRLNETKKVDFFRRFCLTCFFYICNIRQLSDTSSARGLTHAFILSSSVSASSPASLRTQFSPTMSWFVWSICLAIRKTPSHHLGILWWIPLSLPQTLPDGRYVLPHAWHQCRQFYLWGARSLANGSLSHLVTAALAISCDPEPVRQEKWCMLLDNSPKGVLVFLGFATRVINTLAFWRQATTCEIACGV